MALYVAKTNNTAVKVNSLNNVVGKPKEEETKTIAPNFLLGDVIVKPSQDKVLSQVTITKASTLISSNIKSGVNVFGINGLYEGESGPTLIANYTDESTELAFDIYDFLDNCSNYQYCSFYIEYNDGTEGSCFSGGKDFIFKLEAHNVVGEPLIVAANDVSDLTLEKGTMEFHPTAKIIVVADFSGIIKTSEVMPMAPPTTSWVLKVWGWN